MVNKKYLHMFYCIMAIVYWFYVLRSKSYRNSSVKQKRVKLFSLIAISYPKAAKCDLFTSLST